MRLWLDVISMGDCSALLLLAFYASQAFYNDAKPVISIVDRLHASSRRTKHVGRGLKSPAVAAMCDPLLRLYANHQQTSRRIVAGLLTEHSLLLVDSKAEHESIEQSTICGGLEGALGELDMLFEDGYKSKGTLRHAVDVMGICYNWGGRGVV